MGRKSLRFVFGIFLAVGTVLAITTWAASPTPRSDSVATAKATIYRPNLIPNLIDQNPWAHWRSPMDMMRQG